MGESGKRGYIYIMTSTNHGVLYTGVTNDLLRRVYEHKQGINEGFSKRYHAHILVYYEGYSDIKDAIIREKQLKNWGRKKKAVLIGRMNPEWKDLADGWYE